MVNWKNLIVNPPEIGQGYFIFKIVSKELLQGDKLTPEFGYVHGCLKPPEDGKTYTQILYQKEQNFDVEDSFYLVVGHTINPNKYDYFYVNLNEVL